MKSAEALVELRRDGGLPPHRAVKMQARLAKRGKRALEDDAHG